MAGQKACNAIQGVGHVHVTCPARDLAPDFPWPYLGLAGFYGKGKTQDPRALSENIAAFFRLCPSSTDAAAQRWLATEGNQDRMAKVAVAIRGRLRDETEPAVLQSYETLWALEFRALPPTEHEALGRRVSNDLQRLEKVVPAPDAEFQSLLIRGYKQSGASAASLRAKEDRLLKEFPHSSEALRVTQDRWDRLHKEPTDQSDTAALNYMLDGGIPQDWIVDPKRKWVSMDTGFGF